MVVERAACPQLDHDTLVFVLEELNDQIHGISSQMRQAVSDEEYEIASRHFFESSALSVFWDRLMAAYKEQVEAAP